MGKTLIVAEAGSNHNRNFEQALKLIDVAKESGADAVKFQTFSSETVYSKYTPDFAGYKNLTKLVKDLELPRNWQKNLKSYCDDNGIEFMSTPFDEKAVDELFDLGVKRFKISGFEATDPRFVKYVADTNLPLIISLGIGTDLNTMFKIQRLIYDLDDVVDVHLGTYDFSGEQQITYLHCNNAYPTPFEDINLGQMKSMRHYCDNHKWFVNTDIGLSDHTEGILIPPVAVSLGAKVIEKHFTLDRSLSGPDHPFAIEPNELKEMVRNIRLVESSMGEKKTKYTDSEVGFSMARRSVIVNGDVRNGDVVTKNNVTTKRPLLKDSIPASEYYNILGRKFSRDLSDDMILKKGDVE